MSSKIKTNRPDDIDPRRIAEEINELERVHNQIIKKRGRLEAEAARLKQNLEEVETAKVEMIRMVNGMQTQIENYQIKIEEAKDMEFRATHDDLTGLWNRSGILAILRRELVRGEREGTLVGVLIAELDDFKFVKDTYGHLAGDEVLREASRRIGVAVRSYDAVGRFGDDYFLIVLPGCESQQDMMKQAERIRAMVAGGPVTTVAALISTTVSIGVAASLGRVNTNGGPRRSGRS